MKNEKCVIYYFAAPPARADLRADFREFIFIINYGQYYFSRGLEVREILRLRISASGP